MIRKKPNRMILLKVNRWYRMRSMIEEKKCPKCGHKEKVKNGEQLAKNMSLIKELISSYFVSCENQYEWLCDEFNTKNIHRLPLKNRALKKRQFYEHTLEYKLKHPIVVTLRKFGVYEDAKKLLGI